ncbi:uncharacterized protein LOC116268051 [Nymphaea colorata]|nr:uncharacterized protein LOC116268051 [Nymphaea colorata]
MSIIAGACMLILAYASVMLLGFYQIKEGQVGLIKEFGVLKNELIEPGFHFRVPGMQEVIRMDLMIQTDKVERVPCGTANGLLITKHTLQEIYIDLFDRLDEELMKALSQDLKKWAPGIEILSVRVTKPTIPKKILQNVEQMEKVKVEFLIAVENKGQ